MSGAAQMKMCNDYEYRFVAARGLERRGLPSSVSLSMVNGPNRYPKWESVKGDDMLAMTWQELEYIAHVIRDASKVDTASWKPFETAPKVDYEIWVCTDLGEVEAILCDKETGVWRDRDRHVFDPAKEGSVLWLDVPSPPYMDYPCIEESTSVDK